LPDNFNPRWILICAVALLLACPCAFALNPALDVSQYKHTAWKISDGFFRGSIQSIAQTPDGYLWLGTEFGLVRFDGIRPVDWSPPAGQQLPGNDIFKLLVTRDGTLWIGTGNGLANWKGGKLTQYAEFAGMRVDQLLEDREGTLWAGAIGVPNGKLCAIQNRAIHCYGEDSSVGSGVFGLYEDRKASLWVGVETGLWRWKPGSRKLYSLPEVNGIQGLAEDDDGTLLVSRRGGIRRFVDGKVSMAYPFPCAARQYQAEELLRDRDRGLWIGTTGGGLVHVHDRKTDVFSRSEGLSGDSISALFEDGEGSIWIGTPDGLDRFREFAAATFSVDQGLPGAVSSVLAATDGSVWFNDSGRLSRWNQGQIAIYQERAQSGPNALRSVPEIAGSGLPDLPLQSLYQGRRGRIWAATRNRVGYLENERFVPVKGVPGGQVHAMAEDTAGNLWIANQGLGLFQLLPGGAVRQIPWAKFQHGDTATALAADPVHGGLWIGFAQGGIAYLKDDQVSASFTAAGGLGAGSVRDFLVEPSGTLWAATEGGLSRLKDGRVATLTSRNGLPCDGAQWLLEDNDHSFWLGMACGLARVPRSELEQWANAPSESGLIRVKLFDSPDGVRSQSTASGYTPHAGKSPDGKLWFATLNGLSFIDPRHLPFNNLPPPVHVEQITADRKTYDTASHANLRLPPLVRDLEVDYTALSLVAPEKNRFRYKLEGHDRDWIDAGNRRQAFYTDLPPQHYRFLVMAANNSGVWSDAGASFDFSVDPKLYQTGWFQASCAAGFLAMLWGLYHLRLLYLQRQFHIRLDERVNERMRVARDLHDTLLQSFQGVLLKFHAVTFALPDRPAEARKTLESAIEQARQAIAEGREAVQGLRSSTMVKNDLARAISTFGDALAADQNGGPAPGFQVQVEGKSRDLAPLVRDEVYRIAGEALRNAFRHAKARRIEVEIHYDPRQLRLRVRDDGKGIDPQVLTAGGRGGHHGLPGMRERAELVGGKLAVWSQLDSGTEIELTVPSAIAYARRARHATRPPEGQGNLLKG
jgi:signal transduction histidine kinase/ligand-binding sensor domain-containing protein